MPNKYYLTVGINKYPNAPLNGCVNDAQDWAAMLEGLGYRGQTILDGSATKTTIMQELMSAVMGLKYRDTLVFQYSGHGSWVPDRNGDEPDGRDEVLCAYDYENGGLITDDQIYQITSYRAFGTRVIILSDSCHSGSIHKLVNAGELRDVQPPVGGYVGVERIRYMPPGYFLTGNDLQKAHEVVQLPAKGVSRRGSVLISGCNDDEYSYDAWINNRYNGAFTYNAIKAFEEGLTMKQWYSRLVPERLPSGSYPQTPQLQGSWYQKTFWRL